MLVHNLWRTATNLAESKALFCLSFLVLIHVAIIYSFGFSLILILIQILFSLPLLFATQHYVASGGYIDLKSTSLSGKTIIITGANTGIGKEAAKNFALSGARVILACRDKTKTLAAIQSLQPFLSKSKSTGSLEFRPLDLSSLSSVRQFAQSINTPIDILVNNAGVMFCPYSRSQEQYELQNATNHLGHFLLTLLLMPVIKERVITVSSAGHAFITGKVNWERAYNVSEKQYDKVKSYAESKLANILFTRELQKRIESRGKKDVECYVLHPGSVRTELVRHVQTADVLMPIFGAYVWMKSPEQGARTTVYLAKEKKEKLKPGRYYADSQLSGVSVEADDKESARELWDLSKKLAGLTSDEVDRISEVVDL
eukprot:TRINITY_DN987_c0_g1_i1.p1 TRINITY_DN987_c0_g1~~TRINITY_DN987_c0_g1_i1.p1  ORF type:complete len:382 (+),score=74.97 TRINITY_DN987_c0_g1_i1:36-1148(+)